MKSFFTLATIFVAQAYAEHDDWHIGLPKLHHEDVTHPESRRSVGKLILMIKESFLLNSECARRIGG